MTQEPKRRTPASLAATAFNNLQKLEASERAEIANAPQTISIKYAAKRAKILDNLDAETKRLVVGMLGAAEA